MKNMRNIYVILQTHVAELVRDVREAMEEGWSPLGSLYGDENFLCQPMVYGAHFPATSYNLRRLEDISLLKDAVAFVVHHGEIYEMIVEGFCAPNPQKKRREK